MKRKNGEMKKLIFSGLFLFYILSANSQEPKSVMLQDLEKTKSTDQSTITTATIKSATRLFKDKDDLTSVILVIPADSIVNVLSSDDTFLKVDFQGSTGYIYTRHAEINKTVLAQKSVGTNSSTSPDDQYIQGNRPVQESRIDRYSYLESKYGSTMASRLYSGKIWKGMNSQMVKDSWGSPKKITRIISSNTIREEWIYNNTWLSFQNSTLTGWGPVK